MEGWISPDESLRCLIDCFFVRAILMINHFVNPWIQTSPRLEPIYIAMMTVEPLSKQISTWPTKKWPPGKLSLLLRWIILLLNVFVGLGLNPLNAFTHHWGQPIKCSRTQNHPPGQSSPLRIGLIDWAPLMVYIEAQGSL